jgi:uncharacterized protein (TIGR02099 family)
MTQLLRTSARYLINLVVALLVLLAIIASLGRYYLPYVAEYREPLLREISQRSGVNISASKLQGSWAQLSPIVTAYDLEIGPDPQSLKVPFASLKLDLLRSIWHQTIVPASIEVAGMRLPVVQREDGKFALDVDWLPATGNTSIDVAAVYDGLRQLQLRDLNVALALNNGDRFKLEYLNLDYTKQFDDWRAVGNAIPDDAALPVNLIVEGRGLPLLRDYEIHAYTKLLGVDLSPYLARLDYQGWKPAIGKANAEFWLDYGSNKLLQLQGDVDIEDMRFDQRNRDQHVVIPALKSQFKAFLPREGNISVWLRDLDIALQDDERIQFRQAQLLPEADNLTASFDSIAVEPVQRLLRRFEILPDAAQRLLTNLAPAGWLHDITVRIPEGRDVKNATLTARLEDISVQPWKGAPGGTGLNGSLFARVDSGVVQIKSHKLSLSFPKLYEHDLHFDEVSGLVSWQIVDKYFARVQSDQLQLSSEAGRAKAYFDLDLPLRKEDSLESPPHMNLVVELADSEAKFRNQFIPYTLNADLRGWLEKSIKAGDVTEGAFIYRGPLTKDAGLARTTQLYFDIREGELEYDAQWPAVNSFDARLYVDDSDVRVEAQRGSIAGLNLEDALIRYDPTPSGKGGNLRIDGDISGSTQHAFTFFAASPLHDVTRELTEHWTAGGEVNARIKARLPLGIEGKRESVDVKARLRNASLHNESLRLDIEDINGPLRYRSKNGLTSAGLIASLWDDPLTATLRSQPGEKAGLTLLEFQGAAASKAALEWLRVSPLANLVTGELAYQGVLQLGGEESKLTLHSDLRALQSELPAPMTKALGESMPLDVNIYFDHSPARMQIRLGELLRSALILNPDQAVSGSVVFGDVGPAQYNGDGLRLSGAIGRLQLNPWLDVLQQLSAAAQGNTSGPAFYAQRIDIGQVDMLGVAFNDVVVSLTGSEQEWTVAFDSPRAAGRVVNAGWPLDVQLDKLYLPASKQAQDEGGFSDEILEDVFPAEIPAMTFSLADLWVGEYSYGQWSLRVTPIQHGTEFSEINATIGGMQISGPGVMRWRRVGDQQQTEFKALLQCADLGTVLEEWEYEPAIRSKTCRFDTDLNWYGSPLGFDMQTMAGTVGVELTQGQFLESNSTANVLRLFSLFNFDTILRRLQFNFSDVFNRGLSYDHLRGEFQLANGQLLLSETLDVKGPSSSFQMNGSIDMINETMNTDLIVTLPISSNLPWVAALAGGLPVAAGVYVAGKIFQNQFEKLSSASYSLQGSWDQPEVKLKRIFDDEGDNKDKNKTEPVAKEAQASDSSLR